MNTEILLAAEGEQDRVQAGFQAASHFIAESERRFTRFSETSELAQLNRSAGRWFSASLALFEVIRLALQFVDLTGGLFDPSILGALQRAGYDRSMDDIREMGVSALPERKSQDRPDIRGVKLDEQKRRIYLPQGLSLDLGGIAKGWIAGRAAQLLSRYTDVCAVNAGGDMTLLGLPDGETAWEVDLEDPRQTGDTLGVLRVRPGAVATSSVTRRRWLQGDRERHHLIDPRTGEPAESPWLSVTVYAATAVQAEVFAKALLIAGPIEASGLIRRCPAVAFLAVDREGQMWVSKNYQECFDVARKLSTTTQ